MITKKINDLKPGQYMVDRVIDEKRVTSIEKDVLDMLLATMPKEINESLALVTVEVRIKAQMII